MKLIRQEFYEISDRPKLDWMTFNSYRPKLLKAKGGKTREVNKVADILKDNFRFINRGMNLESECKSIYIKVSTTNLQICFRGTFFTLYGESSFNFLRYIHAKLFLYNHQCNKFEMTKKKLKPNWLITRVDVKRDVVDQFWHEILPIGDKAYKNLYQPLEEYNFFKCEKRPYENKNGETTGISYYLGEKWQLNLYSKTLENQTQKNKTKRDMYDKSIQGRNVTRVELTIYGSQSNSYANYLFHNNADLTEDFFCKEILTKWSKSHKVMISQRKIEPRWKSFFSVGEIKKRNSYGKVEIKSQESLVIADRFVKAAVTKFIEVGTDIDSAIEFFKDAFKQRQKEFDRAKNLLATNRETGKAD